MNALRIVPVFAIATLLTAQQVTWWDKDLTAALAAAAAKPAKMVLLYCWQDKHDACSNMFSGTLSDTRVAKELADFICMGVQNDDAGRATFARYRVNNVPRVLFVDPDGAVVDVLDGYVTIEPFLAHLARIKKGENTIKSLRDQIAAKPDDLDLLVRLMAKLRLSGDEAGAREVIDAMLRIDPRCKTPQAAEAKLQLICAETFKDGTAPEAVDLAELRRFLKKQRNKRVLFLGYDRMAAAEYRRDNLKAAASAAKLAWKNVPADERIAWGQNVCSIAYRRWKDLDAANKRYLKDVLAISKATLKAVEKRHAKEPDKTFLGNAMYLHAAILIVNKKRKEALALMQAAMKVDPNNANLKPAYENWLKGNK